MEIKEFFTGEWIRARVESDPIYRRAVEYAQMYHPDLSKDYSWVHASSLEEYKRLEARVDKLDEKADGLIRYLGAGSGLIALISTYTTVDWFTFSIQIIPALILFFLALVFSGVARKPEKLPIPPHTRTAFEYADAYEKEEAKASFAAMVGAASIGLALASTYKGALIRRAFFCFILGIMWMAITAIYLKIGPLVLDALSSLAF